MAKRPYTSYNPYFVVPFLIWAVVGAILLLSFDKQALFSAVNTHYTTSLDSLMFYTTDIGEAYTISSVLLLLCMVVPSFRNWWYFITAVACNVMPTLVTQLVKHAVNAPRPLKYFNEASWIHTTTAWPRYFVDSFPSGHSTGAFAFFCFLSYMLPEKHKKVALLFIITALGVACSRLYLAAHFFADVYAGSMIGTITCTFMFAIMKRYEQAFFKKKDTFS